MAVKPGLTRRAALKGAAVVATAKAVPDLVEIFDHEQRSEEWFTVRRGLPTASRFATIMSIGDNGEDAKGRTKLLYRIAGERLTGRTSESFVSEAMQRGIDMEPKIRERYARSTFAEVTQPGFVRRTIHNRFGGPPLVIGASPDSFIGDDGTLEIKTTMPELLIPIALKGAAGLPATHKAQCHGTLWVTGRRWCDLVIDYEGMPTRVKFRIERDDVFIQKIRDQVERFDYEVRELVKRLEAMGGA